MTTRLFVKVTRDLLPQVRDKFPFIYLEYGRLEVDESSVKWISCDRNVVAIPVATINCIMLGPGTTVTQEAVKVVSSTNCGLLWVGEDTLHFYAVGISPTADTRNLLRQIQLSCNSDASLQVARRMFAYRFHDDDLEAKSLQVLMGMEGSRVKSLYRQKAKQYGVAWNGRDYVPGNSGHGSVVNRMLTSMNAQLYGIVTSVIHSLGYSPRVGFIHSGSPLPFVYDIADLYKAELTVDLAFSLASNCTKFDSSAITAEFRKRVSEMHLLEKIPEDIKHVLEGDAC